jgi:hypothetical protein
MFPHMNQDAQQLEHHLSVGFIKNKSVRGATLKTTSCFQGFSGIQGGENIAVVSHRLSVVSDNRRVKPKGVTADPSVAAATSG